MRTFFTLIFLGVLQFAAHAQNMSINSTGSAPDNSAMLDISDTTRGFLMPRMSTSQMNAIVTPAPGLMVYNTDSAGLYFFNGASWFDVADFQSSSNSSSQHQIQHLGAAFTVAGAGNFLSATNYTYSGDSIILLDNSSGWSQFILLSDAIVSISSIYPTATAGNFHSISINGTQVARGQERGNGASVTSDVSATFFVTQGDTLELGGSAAGAGNWFLNMVAFNLGNSAVGGSQSNDTTQIADADNNTKIQVEESANEDIIRFDLGGTERFVMEGRRIEFVNTGGSVYIGEQAGANDVAGSLLNVAVGDRALESNSGSGNVAIGRYAGRNQTSGFGNTNVGQEAGYSNTVGSGNTIIGYRASILNTPSSNNTVIGQDADFFNTGGSNNTIIGYRAGRGAASHTKSGNVFIGSQAGFNDTTNNKLYIENSNSSTPLIYGDFTNDSVKIYGLLALDSAKNGTGYSLPGADGSAGQVLQTDGLGRLRWANTGIDNDWDTTATQVYSTKRVGVGLTNPTAPLQIESTAPINANSGQILISESNTSNTMFIGRTQTYGYVQSQNLEPLALNPLGNNVGIGTDNPNKRLTISENTSQSFFNLSSAGQNTVMEFNNSGSNPGNWTVGYLGNTGGNPGVFTFLNGGHRLSISNNGNVGINNTNPLSKLEVYSSSNGTLSYAQRMYNSDTTILFAIRDDGNVGIGTISPTATLSVNGTANNATGNWTIFSDQRIKEVKSEFTDGLDVVLNINPVVYNYNDKAPFQSDDEQIGIIAQELEKIAPYMVNQTEYQEFSDLREVSGQAYVFLLINAIKEQQAIIDSLTASDIAHKKDMNELKAMLEQIIETNGLSVPSKNKATDTAAKK